MGLDGYLWEVTTVHEGVSSTTQFVTTSTTITEDSRFGWVAYDPNPDGTYPVQCGNFNNGVKNIVTEEISELGRVDYNHTTGNKVIIDLGDDSWNHNWQFPYYMITTLTDDFVPDSPGATYVFRSPFGRTEFVVGQTYTDFNGNPRVFTGSWDWQYNDMRVCPGSLCSVAQDEVLPGDVSYSIFCKYV